jgi:hypothetical protein
MQLIHWLGLSVLTVFFTVLFGFIVYVVIDTYLAYKDFDGK